MGPNPFWSYETISELLYYCILFSLLCLCFLFLILTCLLLFLFLRIRSIKAKRTDSHEIVGFFHPYCNAGGGGERVLWSAIVAIRRRYPTIKIAVYTGDTDVAPDQILLKAKQRFSNIHDVNLQDIQFVYLHSRHYVEASSYPYATLLGQSLGSVLLGLEALNNVVPDIYVDTMGYAFTLPLFRYLARCRKVACYVHYPTISTDMLRDVRVRRLNFNNSSYIARSRFATQIKLLYYKWFAKVYGWVGSCSNVTLVNSSWTEEHINSLWCTSNIVKVYPPCDVSEFSAIELIPDQEKDTKVIVSIGQFRPEKDHALQIKAMFELRQILSEEVWEKVKLVIIGGCRNKEDEIRVQDLKDLCKHLAVEDNVEFKVNLSFHDLKREMKNAMMGIHTMWNEHFGIAVVEMMAAGLITIAHRTGGPLMDIIVEEESSRNGFLAIHDQEYAAAIAYILGLTDEARDGIRERARSSVKRFSDQEFEAGWLRATAPLFQ